MTTSKTLIFDADCAFCRTCVVWGQRNLSNFPAAVGFQFLQPEAYGLTSLQVQRSIWLVSNLPDAAEPISAGRAVSQILRQQPQVGWRFLGTVSDLPGIRLITKALYYLVAANRQRLPGGTSECELPKQKPSESQ